MELTKNLAPESCCVRLLTGVGPLRCGFGAQTDLVVQHPFLSQHFPHLHQQIWWVDTADCSFSTLVVTLVLIAKFQEHTVYIRQLRMHLQACSTVISMLMSSCCLPRTSKCFFLYLMSQIWTKPNLLASKRWPALLGAALLCVANGFFLFFSFSFCNPFSLSNRVSCNLFYSWCPNSLGW